MAEKDMRDEREDRGNSDFAAMEKEKQHDASKGEHNQGNESNPGKLPNDREKASEAGGKGGQH